MLFIPARFDHVNVCYWAGTFGINNLRDDPKVRFSEIWLSDIPCENISTDSSVAIFETSLADWKYLSQVDYSYSRLKSFKFVWLPVVEVKPGSGLGSDVLRIVWHFGSTRFGSKRAISIGSLGFGTQNLFGYFWNSESARKGPNHARFRPLLTISQ